MDKENKDMIILSFIGGFLFLLFSLLIFLLLILFKMTTEKKLYLIIPMTISGMIVGLIIGYANKSVKKRDENDG